MRRLTGVAAAIFSAINLGLLFTPISGAAHRRGDRRSRAAPHQPTARASVRQHRSGGRGNRWSAARCAPFFLLYQSLIASAGARAQELNPQITSMVFNSVIGDISLLLFVGLAAAAVYGRFKMRS
ncbi:MAG: hypothetical protein U0703_18720 [Anaerolineae bacterium]